MKQVQTTENYIKPTLSPSKPDPKALAVVQQKVQAFLLEIQE